MAGGYALPKIKCPKKVFLGFFLQVFFIWGFPKIFLTTYLIAIVFVI